MLPNQKEHPLSVLLIATNWWPISARLAIRFIGYGCVVSALCPRGHLLNHVSGMKTFYSYEPFDPVASQESAILCSQPDLIVPCDDAAVWQLHETHQRRPDLRCLIETSIGIASEYDCIRSRAGLMHVAQELGLRIPDTLSIRCEKDIGNWSFATSGPAVMKLDGTWGGNGVKVVRSEVEALAAFRELNRPLRSLIKWKRYLVNCDPLAFWPSSPPGSAEVSLQKFIHGRPANAMLLCCRGKVLGLVAVEVLATQGKTGVGTIIRIIQNAEIAEISNRLADRLCLSGFHGLDFIIEETTGAPYLIELNPRCTQLGHLVLPGQGDLVGAFCRCLGSKTAYASDPPIDEKTVAFFPQAVAWNFDSPYFAQSHQDIPWQEPALVRELLRESWPERRWPMRLYTKLSRRKPDPRPHLENLQTSDRLAIHKLLAHSP